jgi:hypothetical protein
MKPTPLPTPVVEPGSLADRRQRERKVWWIAAGLSALFHLLLLLVGSARPFPESPFSAAGPASRDNQAAAGNLMAVQLASARPDAAVPPPVPVAADVEPVEVEPEPDATPEVDPDPTPRDEVGTGTSQGAAAETQAGADAGRPTGTGAGDGGTGDEGRFRITPATPRGLIIPPTNSRLRGREVRVWVFVNEQGRVVPDSTRLEPPTSDRRYNQQLMSEAAQWVFQPAREGDRPVASWFPYVISM